MRRETFVDGSLVGSAPLTGVMSVNNEPLRIGATQDNPGTTWFQGDIAEIMLYDRALSDTELQEVTQMLGEKWLNWPPVVSKDVIGHFTIDGFSCFMVTGDVEVKSTPLVYNAREGSFTVSVRVKSGKPDYYDRNSIALYHNEEGQMEQVDRISTDRYLIDNSGAGGTTDNNFLFDIDEANKEIFYKVKFNNVINLNVSFTISTYISI